MGKTRQLSQRNDIHFQGLSTGPMSKLVRMRESPVYNWSVALNSLRAWTPYRLEWFNPVTGVRHPTSQLTADPQGNAVLTPPGDEPHDWAAVITK